MDLNFTPKKSPSAMKRAISSAPPSRIHSRQGRRGRGSDPRRYDHSQRILNARGWATVNWPLEWGGQDWTPIQVYLYQDEMQAANVPAPSPSMSQWLGR